MSGIDVRALGQLVTVVEEGSFTRAAERLGISQPALSRAIRSLEDVMGVALLVRRARGVEATAAGEVLVQEGRQLQRRLRDAVHAARRAHIGTSTALRISARGCEVADAETLAVHYNTRHIHERPHGGLRSYRGAQDHDEGPGPLAEAVLAHWSTQCDDLREGRAELALLRGPFDHRGLNSHLLTLEPRIALVPAGHALAGRAAVTRADLAGDPVLVWAGSQEEERAYWLGLTPRYRDAVEGAQVDDLLQMLGRVQLAQGIAFVPLALLRLYALPEQVRAIVVEDLPEVEVRLAWPRGQVSPAVAAFIRCAIDHAHEVLPKP